MRLRAKQGFISIHSLSYIANTTNYEDFDEDTNLQAFDQLDHDHFELEIGLLIVYRFTEVYSVFSFTWQANMKSSSSNVGRAYSMLKNMLSSNRDNMSIETMESCVRIN